MSHGPAARRPHPSGEACRVCGGCLWEAFPGVLLGDVPVVYGICQSCGSLILPNPHWLDRSYRAALDPDPDTGVELRTDLVGMVVEEFRASGCLPPGRALDYGAGRGLLLGRLVAMGLDAWGFDPYLPPHHRRERMTAQPPEGSFALITCIEVIEHTLDPGASMARLAGLLEAHGILLLSTELFDAGRHGPDWWYLTPQHGQHVTILSRDGLALLVEQGGLHWHASIPLEGRPFLHIMTLKGGSVPPAALATARARVLRWERAARVRRYVAMVRLLWDDPATLVGRIRRRLRRQGIGGTRNRTSSPMK